MNSEAAQLTENGTEIVRLFARSALRAYFLSAVADRCGLLGRHGGKNVSWGYFAHFVEYTGAVMSLFPKSLAVSFAWAATIAETHFGIMLIAGFKTRMTSILSGLLLLSFATGMATGLGIKTPLDYSVFSAASAAFLLAFWEPDRFTLDKLLNRSRSRTRVTLIAQMLPQLSQRIKGARAMSRKAFDVHHVPYALAKMVQYAVESFTVVRLGDKWLNLIGGAICPDRCPCG